MNWCTDEALLGQPRQGFLWDQASLHLHPHKTANSKFHRHHTEDGKKDPPVAKNFCYSLVPLNGKFLRPMTTPLCSRTIECHPSRRSLSRKQALATRRGLLFENQNPHHVNLTLIGWTTARVRRKVRDLSLSAADQGKLGNPPCFELLALPIISDSSSCCVRHPCFFLSLATELLLTCASTDFSKRLCMLLTWCLDKDFYQQTTDAAVCDAKGKLKRRQNSAANGKGHKSILGAVSAEAERKGLLVGRVNAGVKLM